MSIKFYEFAGAVVAALIVAISGAFVSICVVLIETKTIKDLQESTQNQVKKLSDEQTSLKKLFKEQELRQLELNFDDLVIQHLLENSEGSINHRVTLGTSFFVDQYSTNKFNVWRALRWCKLAKSLTTAAQCDIIAPSGLEGRTKTNRCYHTLIDYPIGYSDLFEEGVDNLCDLSMSEKNCKDVSTAMKNKVNSDETKGEYEKNEKLQEAANVCKYENNA